MADLLSNKTVSGAKVRLCRWCVSAFYVYDPALSVLLMEQDAIDWVAMSKEAADNANELICSDAVSNLMVKSGATYRYVYLDKNGKKVGVVKIDKCSPLQG